MTTIDTSQISAAIEDQFETDQDDVSDNLVDCPELTDILAPPSRDLPPFDSLWIG